jgi:hypothetical protein
MQALGFVRNVVARGRDSSLTVEAVVVHHRRK